MVKLTWLDHMQLVIGRSYDYDITILQISLYQTLYDLENRFG